MPPRPDAKEEPKDKQRQANIRGWTKRCAAFSTLVKEGGWPEIHSISPVRQGNKKPKWECATCNKKFQVSQVPLSVCAGAAQGSALISSPRWGSGRRSGSPGGPKLAKLFPTMNVLRLRNSTSFIFFRNKNDKATLTSLKGPRCFMVSRW